MKARRLRLGRWCAAALAVLLLGACSATSAVPAGTTSSTSASSGQLSGTVTVAAASSLKRAFDQLAAQFEAQHPQVKVSLSYDGSAVLATQLVGGAPVDVFASADDKNMAKVSAAGLITAAPQEFATNTLQIAVLPGNPKKINGLADLTRAGLAVDLCAPAQPCGSASQKVLAAAKVRLTPVSQEQSVSAVLLKVESGDADAGLVYRTDVLAAGGKVAGVDFPQAAGAVNHYPIAALDHAPHPAAAVAFVALVVGSSGRQVLQGAGFGPPGA